jgi:hypothetical protein
MDDSVAVARALENGCDTQPGAGTGTGGSGMLTSSLSEASYNTSYGYTNLGQIWQGSQNGQGAAVQYLSCDSSYPH